MTKHRTRRTDRNKRTTHKGTLDQKHMERINQFEKMTSSLPKKKKKLDRLQNDLDTLVEMNPNECGTNDIRQKAHLMDAIDKLRKEINSIENCNAPLSYIVDTLPILIDYYDNDEGVDGTEEEVLSDLQEANGKRNILSYLVNDNKKKQAGSKQSSNKTKITKATLYQNYRNLTETGYKKTSTKTNTNICKKQDCDGEMVLCHGDGYMVCQKCALCEPILIFTEKPNYKEPTQDSGTYAYKRINHLTEILSQLQAKESTDIPQKVFENVFRELKRRKISKDELDIFRLRRILKRLNLRKYYEHVPHILQIINGKEPPNFSRQDEMQIKKMFKDIQKPFSIYCPKNRKNFLNYSYVLHKFCELLGLDEYISYFPLLKNHAKLLQHDKIWKNICEYMRWEFYKSL